MSVSTIWKTLACICLMMLAGCIRYEEVVDVDQNGKGTATFTMSRPKRGIVDKVRGHRFDGRFDLQVLNKDLPAGVTCEPSQMEKEERVEVKAVYKFDDINKLIGWAAKTESPLNNLSVTRSGDKLEMTRRFATLEKEDLEAIQKYGPDVPVVFKFTGPGKVSAHNGTRVEGNTVIWELKAPELFANGGKTLNAQFFFGTPMWVYGLIAFLVFDTIIVALVFMKRAKAAPATAPSAEVK